MIRVQTTQLINVQDWDDLVEQTYGKHYDFQQQDGCRERQLVHITVPYAKPYDYKNDTVPERINGKERGVSFAAWLARDPQEWNGRDDSDRELFWERNFYPSVEMLVNDLHARGLLPAGEYAINIDW